jgi:hypothetical protein
MPASNVILRISLTARLLGRMASLEVYDGCRYLALLPGGRNARIPLEKY